MGVSMFPAKLSETTLYFGEAMHSDYGYVHVLGYQNKAENNFHGPNAMILHFPADKPMTPQNVIDTKLFDKFLDDMVRTVKKPEPVMRGMDMRRSAKSPLYSFVHDIYHIVMSADASRIPEALQSVPEHKRPQLNQNLFDWYAQEFPDRTLALCCFNNTEAKRATPMLWFYTPKDKDTFFAPAIDCHTGGTPVLGALVDVDHWCIVGSHRLTTQHKDVLPVVYSQDIPEDVKALLPSHIMGRKFSGQMPNSDFFFQNAPRGLSKGNIDYLTRDQVRVF